MTLAESRHADCTPIFVGMLLDTIGGHFDRHAGVHSDMAQRMDGLSGKLDALAAGLPELGRQIGEVRAGVQELLAKLAALNAAAPTTAVESPPELTAAPDQP